MWTPSPVEIVIVLIIVLVIFGPKRLPDLGRSLGRGMREFKDSVTGKDKEREELEAAATAAAKDKEREELEAAEAAAEKPKPTASTAGGDRQS
jgi:sec-independent protein translocase protein TatA